MTADDLKYVRVGMQKIDALVEKAGWFEKPTVPCLSYPITTCESVSSRTLSLLSEVSIQLC